MTTNQDQTIYVTENKQEFVPEERSNCRGVNQLGISNIFYVTRDPLRKDRKNYIGIYLGGPSSGLVDYFQELLPLKTEAALKRESVVREMQKNVDFYNPDVEYVMFSLCDAGYIKPREITEQAIANELGDKVDARYYTAFIHGTRWAEKHIKGED